jgi:hypothetical protein
MILAFRPPLYSKFYTVPQSFFFTQLLPIFSNLQSFLPPLPSWLPQLPQLSSHLQFSKLPLPFWLLQLSIPLQLSFLLLSIYLHALPQPFYPLLSFSLPQLSFAPQLTFIPRF